jgi:hypothetical protein
MADTIHLKNGSKLKGKIVEETDDSFILDTGKEKITVPKSDILYVGRDAPPEEPEKKPEKKKDKPEAKPEDKPEAEQDEKEKEAEKARKKEEDAIKKALKKWMSDRKKIRCKSCKGLGKKICPACKGSGKDVLREPYTGRVIRSETCKYCDGEKLVMCKKCENGLSAKYAGKVFWDILPPKRKKALEKDFESKKGFLKWLYKAFRGDLGGHEKLAGKIEFVDHHKHMSYEVLKYELNEDMTEATVSVRLKENLNQKKHERLVEKLRWFKEDGKWYLDIVGD